MSIKTQLLNMSPMQGLGFNVSQMQPSGTIKNIPIVPQASFGSSGSAGSAGSNIGAGIAGSAAGALLNGIFGLIGGKLLSKWQKNLMDYQYGLLKNMFDYTFGKLNAWNVWLQQHLAELSKQGLKNAGLSAAGMTDGFTTANSTLQGMTGILSAGLAVNPFSNFDIVNAMVGAATARKLNAESEQIESDNMYKDSFSLYKVKAAELGLGLAEQDIIRTKVQTALDGANIALTGEQIDNVAAMTSYVTAQVRRYDDYTDAQISSLLASAGLSNALAARLIAELPYVAKYMVSLIKTQEKQLEFYHKSGQAAIMQGQAAQQLARNGYIVACAEKLLKQKQGEKVDEEKLAINIANQLEGAGLEYKVGAAEDKAYTEARELFMWRESPMLDAARILNNAFNPLKFLGIMAGLGAVAK